MLTCFMVLINDNGSFYSLIYLKGWGYYAGLIFWFLYILLTVFILFNFLIAIIVDAFMEVKVSVDHDAANKSYYRMSCFMHFKEIIIVVIVVAVVMDIHVRSTESGHDVLDAMI